MLSVDLSLYAGALIVGDFNYPDIQWTEGSSFTTSFSGDEQALANLFLDYNFFQFVDRPTQNANLLDLVFTNSPELLLSIDSGFHLQDVGLPSDHCPVKVRNFDQRFRLDFSKANFEIFFLFLSHPGLGLGVNII